MNTKKTRFRHVIAKLLKMQDKESILKAARRGGKIYHLHRIYNRAGSNFYAEAMETRRQWDE